MSAADRRAARRSVDGEAVPASRRVRRPGDALLLELARTRRVPIALSAGGAIGHQAFEALVPVLIGATIDRAVAPGDGTQLLLWLGVLAATFVALNTAFRVQVVVGVRVAEWAAHELRLRLADRVLDPRGMAPASPSGDEAATSSGALLSVAGADAAQASLTLRGLVVTLGAISALVVASAVLVGVSWPLGLLVLAGTPVLLVVVQRLARPLQRRTADEQARAADASAVATDLVRGLRVLKGIGAERTAAARYRETSERSLRSTLRAAVASSALEGGTTLVSGILLAVVTIVAGRLALDGDLSVGELVAAAGVTQFLVGPMQRLGMAGRLFAEGRASADRVARVLHAAPAVAASADGDGDGDDAPQLELRGLRLAGRDGVLHARAAPGELLGLAAADPADAAAIVDVLARRRTPDAGAVLLGDRDVAGTAPPAERPALLVADHEAELFEGSVAENVRALVPADARAGDVEPAMAAADASEVVRALPRGADSPVGEGGGALSGGQRQRVALARALLAAPRALVLHEPTTAVDAVTEERIAGGVRRLRAGRTTLVVATSPALLRACDRVVLVVDGVAVAEGPHDALVRESAAYREAVLR